jgi:hypothetical protein
MSCISRASRCRSGLSFARLFELDQQLLSLAVDLAEP